MSHSKRTALWRCNVCNNTQWVRVDIRDGGDGGDEIRVGCGGRCGTTETHRFVRWNR